MSEFLTLVEVLAIHQDQIERYGGAHGVRDPGQLEAALYRCQTGYYQNTLEEAAALWESLGQNQAFIDGNKPTAFAAMFTFLAINGIEITADAQAAYAFISERYATNSFALAQLLHWLRENTAPALLDKMLA
jgi:death-on-curing protein